MSLKRVFPGGLVAVPTPVPPTALQLLEGGNSLENQVLAVAPANSTSGLTIPADSGKWLAVVQCKYRMSGATFASGIGLQTVLWNTVGTGNQIGNNFERIIPAVTTASHDIIVDFGEIIDAADTPGVAIDVAINSSITNLPSVGSIELYSWHIVAAQIAP